MIPSAATCDLISDLCDDLLLHVLRFLSDDARDVVCTSALSTRWRSLWTRAPVLRLTALNRGAAMDDPYDADNEDPQRQQARFNDFVHGVLTRRTHNVDRLELHASLFPGEPRANEWLRSAMRHTVGSLEFDVSEPPDMMMGLMSVRWHQVDLPTATMLAKMSLHLQARLHLPPAVQFHQLTELTLSSIEFSDEDGPCLGGLLSSPSCCPRLRKLTLSNLSGLHDLRLDGAMLETLHLGHIDVRRLELDAPRLSLLRADNFFMPRHYYEHTSITVRAPALKKLKTYLQLQVAPLRVQHHTIQLLQECNPIHGQTLTLFGPQLPEGEEDDPIAEMPKLPGVTRLKIHFHLENNHYLGGTVTSLLARCSNLEYLHLDNLAQVLSGSRCEEGCSKCNVHESWKAEEISLEHLRNVKFGGFSGRERCWLDMVELLLASAPALERMTVTARASFEFKWLPMLVLAESMETSLPRGRGQWRARRANDDSEVTSEYEWTPNMEMLAINGATGTSQY